LSKAASCVKFNPGNLRLEVADYAEDHAAAHSSSARTSSNQVEVVR